MSNTLCLGYPFSRSAPPRRPTFALVTDRKSPSAQLTLARRQWKGLKDAGAALSYWKQRAEGGWEKQA